VHDIPLKVIQSRLEEMKGRGRSHWKKKVTLQRKAGSPEETQLSNREIRRSLWNSLAHHHESLDLELLGAWEPLDN
jgi:hypothetical protein